MKKIKRGDFWMLDADEAWGHVNALQTELDRLERAWREWKAMTVEEIENFLKMAPHGTVTSRKSLAEYIQPLTVQQGFVPDWSKAPDTVDWIDICWAPGHYREGFLSIPRPAPKTRERTAREKNTALRDFICLNPNFDFGDASTVEEMLTRANISLTVTEE